MNKEQIIIDGVIINACLVSEKCKEFETCKIKNILRQLVRKTKECEELKEKIKQVKDFKDKVINQLKEENHDLTMKLYEYRNALEPFQDEYFKGLDTTTIAELAKKSIRLTTENRKLETALEEIEGILDNDDFGYCPLDDTEDCHHTTYKNILDLISKAKGEE